MAYIMPDRETPELIALKVTSDARG